MVIKDVYEGLYGLDDYQNSESMDSNSQINHEDLNTSLRLKSQSMSSDSDEDGRSKRSRTSPESNSEEGELLGLSLKKTPSFVNLLETQLSEGKNSSSSSPPPPPPPRRVGRPPSRKNKSKMDDFAAASEKLKASNFPAIKLKIGAWERISKHEGDLIGKCYYAKRKLVWEILDGPLKNKIEIQWSDIIGIRAIMPQGETPAVLEIELNQPPLFYRETNPQPRKHTLWQQTVDFTRGQAPNHRRHCVTFPPGALDKHYEKLLCCDARLNQLSKQPFPSLLCPLFDQPENLDQFSDFSYNNNYGSEFFPQMHNPFHISPSSSFTALIPNNRMHSTSAMAAVPLRQFSSSFPVSGNTSAMAAVPLRQFSSSFPLSGGRTSDYANINQRRAVWGGQGSNNLVNVAMGNQTIGMLSSAQTPQANWSVPTSQDHHQPMYMQNESMGISEEKRVLNYIKNHLLNDNHVETYNESMYPLPEHHENNSLVATGDVHGLDSGYQTMNNYAQDVVPNNGMTYAQQVNWMYPQETNQISPYYATVHGGYPTQDVNQDM